ncbi:bifunctional endo-1,4-beta-xylanase xyla-like isoform x1 [Plakobranchus ocellatus]|uniref:Bifunctional endo-1,4-beta-xylanase xyla-like isoform x1 n=1 Tax=Plakobranchus ocellatus TaxID=259542 RepID=A0AAV4AYL7_9GAST|nr:bifunctional endo-1,4-beta-xylanase xyla-like isoform x1 [Plakobranchus ocellatus]
MFRCKSPAENNNVICAECPFTTFYLQHNIPLPVADDMALLLRAVFLTQRKLRSSNLSGRRHQIYPKSQQPLPPGLSLQPLPPGLSLQPLHLAWTHQPQPADWSHQPRPTACSYQPLSQAWSHLPQPTACSYQPLPPKWSHQPQPTDWSHQPLPQVGLTSLFTQYSLISLNQQPASTSLCPHPGLISLFIVLDSTSPHI